jgi:hypothetical protein
MKTIISELPERSQFIRGLGAISIGYPWITPGAIMALEIVINKNFNVLECGAGGSTVFFSKRCESVTALETSPVWAERVKAAAGPNTIIYLMNRTPDFLQWIALQPDGCFDLVSVDTDERVTNRQELSMAIIRTLKMGGWLLLDNYSTLDFRFLSDGWEIWTYDDFAWTYPTGGGHGTRLCKKLK